MAKKKTFENIISNMLGEPVCNLCHAFYDQYVETNVKFRSRAGMKEVIIRRQLGKCCKWCADLAGIYTPENAPDDIYRRHDNCKCMVTYRDENGYTDVWSKKEFKKQKNARASREQELSEIRKVEKNNRLSFVAKVENKISFENELKKLKREAEKEGKHYIDSLEIRKNYKKETKFVGKANGVTIGKKRYDYDGKNVKFNHDPSNKKLYKEWEKEWETAQLITDTLGGKIEMLPRVLKPKDVRVADYLWDGKMCDRKGPTGSGKRTIRNNIAAAKGQANIVALDLTESPIDIERASKEITSFFSQHDFDFLDVVILIKDNKIYKYLERV